MQQHRRAEDASVMEEQAARNVGSVGVADGNKIAAIEAVLGSGTVQELLHLMGTEDQILLIEYPFSEAAEVTRHAILQHISPDTQH
ncbi:hypothetical protein D3C74_436560 [compost metagenome]